MAVVLSAENIPDDTWLEIYRLARKELSDEDGAIVDWFEIKYSAKLQHTHVGSYLHFEFPSKDEYARFALTWL